MERRSEVSDETHGVVISLVEGEPTDPQRRFSGCRSNLDPLANEGRFAEARRSREQAERSVGCSCGSVGSKLRRQPLRDRCP